MTEEQLSARIQDLQEETRRAQAHITALQEETRGAQAHITALHEETRGAQAQLIDRLWKRFGLPPKPGHGASSQQQSADTVPEGEVEVCVSMHGVGGCAGGDKEGPGRGGSWEGHMEKGPQA